MQSKSRELDVHRTNPQLAALVELYRQTELRDLVLGLNASSLDATQMMLVVLQRIDETYTTQYGRALTSTELALALASLIRDGEARHRIVEMYTTKKLLTDKPV